MTFWLTRFGRALAAGVLLSHFEARRTYAVYFERIASFMYRDNSYKTSGTSSMFRDSSDAHRRR